MLNFYVDKMGQGHQYNFLYLKINKIIISYYKLYSIS